MKVVHVLCFSPIILLIFTCLLQSSTCLRDEENDSEIKRHGVRMARWSYYRRRPIFGFNEIPKDSTENCNAYCDAVYGKLLRKHLYYQACIGVCATINECSKGIADCVADATCINTAEGFMCLCPEGYTGDGRLSGTMCSEVLCTEVADCVEDSTCVRTPQSPGYVCLCPGGYFGDGRESGDGCIPPGAVRLANGSDDMEGRVEIFLHGSWGTVCDDEFDNNIDAATVVCNQLGFPGASSFGNFFGPGTGRIWLDDVDCDGTEEELLFCSFTLNYNCDHSEDVSVVCIPP